MAKKDRNKRSARKARAEERAKREAQLAAQPASSSNASQAKAESKAKASKKSDKKPGFFRRIANWFGDVRTEMHKVVWPSKDSKPTPWPSSPCSSSLASSSGLLTRASSLLSLALPV